ncbi:MAG: hypothetical protein WDA14_14615 [Sphaerochaetaceae bacterium]
MSNIHYFQRYSTKENHVTNTILHLFSRIYDYSPYRLNSILNELCGIEIPIGLSIEQQKKESTSVPDGTISQEAFSLRIETKTDLKLLKDQLDRHCMNFPHGAKYLLVITKNPRDEKLVSQLKDEHPGVQIAFSTFKNLCNVISGEFHDYETSIKMLVDDFFTFCSDLNLIPPTGVLRIVPCGKSLELNRKHLCYSHPADRGYSPHDYVGLYKNKSVQLIGKLTTIVDAKIIDGTVGTIEYKGIQGELSDTIKTSIKNMIVEASSQFNWDFSTSDSRFFCFDELYETDYRKGSSGGIQGNRYIDISEFNKACNTVKDLADRLRHEKWGN